MPPVPVIADSAAGTRGILAAARGGEKPVGQKMSQQNFLICFKYEIPASGASIPFPFLQLSTIRPRAGAPTSASRQNIFPKKEKERKKKRKHLRQKGLLPRRLRLSTWVPLHNPLPVRVPPARVLAESIQLEQLRCTSTMNSIFPMLNSDTLCAKKVMDRTGLEPASSASKNITLPFGLRCAALCILAYNI